MNKSEEQSLVWIFDPKSEKKKLSLNYQGNITAITFSSDYTLVAIATECIEDEKKSVIIKILDIIKGKSMCTIKNKFQMVKSLLFSPDNNKIAITDIQGTLIMWDLNSNSMCWNIIAHDDGINSIVFSPDRTVIASVGDKYNEAPNYDETTLKVWGVAGGNMIWEEDRLADYVHAVSFSQDSSLLASASFTNIYLFHSNNGKDCAIIRKAHRDKIWCLAFSPDNKYVASGSSDKTVKLWKISEHNCAHTFLGHHKKITHLLFSEDCTLLVSADNNCVKIWDIASKKELYSLDYVAFSIKNLFVNWDTNILILFCGDEKFRFFNVSTGEEIN